MSEEKVCKRCSRPVSEWPMAFRGDDTCSVTCEKQDAAHEEAVVTGKRRKKAQRRSKPKIVDQ